LLRLGISPEAQRIGNQRIAKQRPGHSDDRGLRPVSACEDRVA
jgi:hypothetical protein